MELTSALLTPAWLVAGAVVYAVASAAAAWRAPWAWLWRTRAANRLAATTAAVLGVWQIRAALGDGPVLHLVGATLLTLTFGWQLALLALGVVLATTTLAEHGAWAALGVNGVINAVLPVAVSYLWARLAEARLPRNLFVYIFAAAYFGALLAVAVSALGGGAILYAAGRLSPHALGGNYLPGALLLALPEAFVTGGLLTFAVVYRPAWVVSFDDARYLARR